MIRKQSFLLLFLVFFGIILATCPGVFFLPVSAQSSPQMDKPVYLPLVFTRPAEIELCGTLTANTVIQTNEIVTIRCNVTIPANINLTIQKGVTLFFDQADSYSIIVEGTLTTEGTAAQPVSFLSNHDLPQPGSWGRIWFRPGSTGNLAYTNLTDGGNFTGTGALHAQNASLTLHHLRIENSAHYGLFAENSNLLLDQSTIINSGHDGVRIVLDTVQDVALIGNTLVSNTGKAIFLRLLNENSRFQAGDNTGAQNGINGIALEGSVGNMTFHNNGLAYVFDSLSVSANQQALVEAGVVFKPGPQGILNIVGELVANGTASAPMVITSQRDDTFAGDTNNDGAATGPQPGDWQAVVVRPGGFLNMNQAQIYFGGAGTPEPGGQIRILDSGANLVNLTVSQGADGGIYAEDGNVTLLDSHIEANQNYGVRLFGIADPVMPIIQNNHFDENGTYPLHLIFHTGGLGNGSIQGNTGQNNGLMNGIFLEGLITGANNRLAANPNFPYVVWTVTVAPAGILRIDPGVVVKFVEPPDDWDGTPPGPTRGTGTLLVGQEGFAGGLLDILADSENPVIFTSFWDDSAGGDTNPGPENPLPGDWRGIVVNAGSEVRFDHVELRYGGTANGAMLDNRGEAVVNYSILRDGIHHGIGNSGILTLMNSMITGHGSNGINNGGPATIKYNAIVTNGDYGLFNYYDDGSNTYRLDASLNYWGAADGPTYDGLPCFHNDLPSGSGSLINCPVIWSPFLVDPPAIENTASFYDILGHIQGEWALKTWLSGANQ